MESEYLKVLSTQLKKYLYVLIYGAGGVTGNLLILLDSYLNRDNVFVVVSKKELNKNQIGRYPVREIDEFISVKDQALVILSVMPRLSLQIEKHIKELGFRNYITADEISKQLYDEIWKTRICKNKIVFSNWDGGGFGGNCKYIALNLLNKLHDLDLVWITKKQDIKLPERIRTVQYGTYEHCYELGTASIWIDNQHKPLFTRKRKGQCYIQTWHGGGPLKKIEFDGENLPQSYLDLCEMNSRLEDIMLSPSRFNSELYRRAFHYQGEIMECGYPRNDIFWRDDSYRKKIERMFEIESEEIIALYAPTFRNIQMEERTILNLIEISQALEKKFQRKCQMMVRFHPSGKDGGKRCTGAEKYIDVTAYDDIQELLVASDILITDYSSVMWDFSLSRKPVFLFHPDVDLYEKERGYYLSFDRMPYIEAFSNEDLCEKIMSFDDTSYRKNVDDFLTEYGSFDEGIAGQAIMNRIMKILEE